MLGSSEKPDGCDGILTLNQGFKGYSLRRHLGDLFSVLPGIITGGVTAADAAATRLLLPPEVSPPPPSFA